jgi:hypothetical protein
MGEKLEHVLFFAPLPLVHNIFLVNLELRTKDIKFCLFVFIPSTMCHSFWVKGCKLRPGVGALSTEASLSYVPQLLSRETSIGFCTILPKQRSFIILKNLLYPMSFFFFLHVSPIVKQCRNKTLILSFFKWRASNLRPPGSYLQWSMFYRYCVHRIIVWYKINIALTLCTPFFTFESFILSTSQCCTISNQHRLHNAQRCRLWKLDIVSTLSTLRC